MILARLALHYGQWHQASTVPNQGTFMFVSKHLAVSGQRSAVSGQRSVVSGQWSAVSGQRSVVSGQWSAVSGQLIADIPIRVGIVRIFFPCSLLPVPCSLFPVPFGIADSCSRSVRVALKLIADS
ncbi:hypothetical protein [Moorena producens]|nr:hypothetical protein [Moorena producens]